MKHGFGQSRKKKKSKKSKGKKSQHASDGDVEMGQAQQAEVTAMDGESGMGEGAAAAGAGAAAAGPRGGRAGHAAIVALKRELRVKVSGLKKTRAKLTKLPGDKASRKLVTAELKEVVQAQRSAGVAKKTKGKLKFRGDAKPGEATMEE